MGSSQGQDSASEPPQRLPQGLRSIQEIRDIPNDQIKKGTFVNVIGFLKDYQSPIRTRGTDYICTFEITDLSIKYEKMGLKIFIFWPLGYMPSISGLRDVVLIRNAKVQMYGGVITLLANKVSEFHILPHSKLIRNSSLPPGAPWSSTSQANPRCPSDAETSYAVWADKNMDDLDLPSDTEFRAKAAQTMNVKDKFSLLSDVKPACFYNIIGQVIRIYDGNTSERLTVYISDYTPNSKFYNYVWGDNPSVNDDEYGYVKRKPYSETTPKWPGPYGKLTIQLTLFDANADFFREKVKEEQWVLIRNVHITDTGGCLEGKLHGDTGRFEGKIHVEILKCSVEDYRIDPKLKDAVARKHAWWKRFELQKQAILNEDVRSGDKRKAVSDGAINSKQRRMAKRAAADQKASAIHAKVAKRLDLNENITCAHPDQPIVSFADILKPRKLMLNVDGQEYTSPFTLCKYRANVRVVNYLPHKLEDFAIGRRISDYDMLSEYSGGEDTDLEEEHCNSWEWRFALQVEDASSKDATHRIWLVVDNHAAQYFLGLDNNATSLRRNKQLLHALREQLFKVWGDLEEQKSAKLKLEKQTAGLPSSSFQSAASESSPKPRTDDQPDPDDSDAEREQSREMTPPKSERNDNPKVTPRNEPFTCCIRQYGVKVREEDPSKANAGIGWRWERRFGLFGTHIV